MRICSPEASSTDITRQVFRRSARMGLVYVIISSVMGVFLSTTLNLAAYGSSMQLTGTNAAMVAALLNLLVVPIGAMVALIITTPVYFLFVSDKTSGVLEYLLAVGMDQRTIFLGYLKASLSLALIAMTPVLLINTAFMNAGLAQTLTTDLLILATGISVVALVSVLMTAFSSLQRRPTGMNSPLGISLGVIFLIPEFVLFGLLRGGIVWVDIAEALSLAVIAAGMPLSLDRLIRREKLLP